LNSTEGQQVSFCDHNEVPHLGCPEESGKDWADPSCSRAILSLLSNWSLFLVFLARVFHAVLSEDSPGRNPVLDQNVSHQVAEAIQVRAATRPVFLTARSFALDLSGLPEEADCTRDTPLQVLHAALRPSNSR